MEMILANPIENPAFSSPQQKPPLTIVIDVQDVRSEMDGPTRQKFDKDFEDVLSYMPREKQENMRRMLEVSTAQSEESRETREEYRQAIKGSVAAIRERGGHILWLAMGNESRLYPANEPRDKRLLHDLHLTGVAPAPGDDIFAKRYFNAGTNISDVIRDGRVVNPILLASLNGQRDDQPHFHQGIRNGSIRQSDYFGTPTFRQHIQNLGVKEVNLMGQMTEYCVTDNAINLAMDGVKVNIFPSLVCPDRQTSWSNYPDHFATEKATLEAAFDKIVADPTSRGFKQSDAKALQEARQRIEYREFPEFVASLPEPVKLAGTAPDIHPPASLAKRGGASLRSITPPVSVETEQASAASQTATGKKDQRRTPALANFDA